MIRHVATAAILPLFLTACGSGSDAAVEVVHNSGEPLWTPEEAWNVVEDLRIGSAMSEGPDLFGAILSFDVDAWGRIFALDDQAQEVRVFDADGTFVRTVGSRGEGPGEFTQAGSVDLTRNGEIWVMGMDQGRVSIFDTAGTYLRQERTNTGGYISKPYRGGFDAMGRYHVVLVGGRLARFDQSFTPIDTIVIPEDPVELEFFETPRASVSVPFQGSMDWRLSPTGTVWTLLTGRYELTEMTTDGAVLRRVTKDHDPIPVTNAEREAAIERLDWFTSQGGEIDPSKFPDSKPATASFFLDDEGNLWVEQAVGAADEPDAGRIFDLFSAEGRFLGTLRLPFALRWSIPEPIVREGVLYGVTSDEAGVPYVVRGRVVKSG